MEGGYNTISGVVVFGEVLRVSVEGREMGRGGIMSGMEERGDIVNAPPPQTSSSWHLHHCRDPQSPARTQTRPHRLHTKITCRSPSPHRSRGMDWYHRGRAGEGWEVVEFDHGDDVSVGFDGGYGFGRYVVLAFVGGGGGGEAVIVRGRGTGTVDGER